MAPKRAGKQPLISSALGSTKKAAKNARRIVESSDSDDSGVEVVEEPTPKRGRGRPRKDAAPVVSINLFAPEHPHKGYSLTVEKRGGHMLLIWFTQICDWLDAKVELHSSSTEIGPKAGHLHMQSIFEAHMLTGPDGLKLFVKELKNVCGVRHGDGAGLLVCVKELVEGQTTQRMVGYTFKDMNLSTFRNRKKNVSEQMIEAGIAEHASLKLSYTDDKILLTKANLFNKAYVKWVNEVAPAKVTFTHVMTLILNDKKHMLSGTILMNSNGQMRRSSAEIYWALIMGKEITEWEVRHMLYMPKGFNEVDYLPYGMPDAPRPGLFGDSDDDEHNNNDEAGTSGVAPGGSNDDDVDA
jgi:hypothetical protein